jgi:hypothetical protein
LLGVIKFGGATSFLPENVVYVFECLFEHAAPEAYDWLTYWRSATISQSKAALARISVN